MRKGRREGREGRGESHPKARPSLGLAISMLDSRGQHELEDAEPSTPGAEGSSLIQGVGTLWQLRGKG